MRSFLKTIRLHPEESRWVDSYLKQNRWIEGFSELARLAILDFIQRKGSIELKPISTSPRRDARPGFLWDYDLDETEVRTILQTEPISKKSWLIARILERAPLAEVFRYLTRREIQEALPKLRMNEKRKRHWEYAIQEWARK